MNAFTLMKVDIVTIMNWMAVIFLTTAAALIAWETYRQRVKDLCEFSSLSPTPTVPAAS